MSERDELSYRLASQSLLYNISPAYRMRIDAERKQQEKIHHIMSVLPGKYTSKQVEDAITGKSVLPEDIRMVLTTDRNTTEQDKLRYFLQSSGSTPEEIAEIEGLVARCADVAYVHPSSVAHSIVEMLTAYASSFIPLSPSQMLIKMAPIIDESLRTMRDFKQSMETIQAMQGEDLADLERLKAGLERMAKE